MLLIVEEYFKNFPARKKVAELLVQLGISVRNSKLYIGDVDVPVNSVAEVAGVNRKIVYHTIEFIEKTYELRNIFERLEPKLSLAQVAPIMGWEVLEIEFKKPKYGCILEQIFRILSDTSCEIRQIVGERENMERSRLIIVLENPVDIEAVGKIRGLEGVETITLHTSEMDKQKIVCNYCKVKYCPRKVSLK
jgi:predicted regulator of amino acid metabolism with ACT domain